MSRKKNIYPAGWDEKRVKRLAAHYEKQSEQAAVAEDTAAFKNRRQTVMVVPNELVPLIGKLIAKHNGGTPSPKSI
jgi:hypothetical protein